MKASLLANCLLLFSFVALIYDDTKGVEVIPSVLNFWLQGVVLVLSCVAVVSGVRNYRRLRPTKWAVSQWAALLAIPAALVAVAVVGLYLVIGLQGGLFPQ